jgi:probable addiction module antidote protein
LMASLQDPQELSCYLQVALESYQESGESQILLVALRNVAEVKGGITILSKKTALNRQALYKTLSSKGNPRLDTFSLLLKGLGFQLSIAPIR